MIWSNLDQSKVEEPGENKQVEYFDMQEVPARLSMTAFIVKALVEENFWGGYQTDMEM